MQCACSILPSVACRHYEIFPHYLINGTIFGKKLFGTKCVFWFPPQLLSETFPIPRRTERDMLKNVYWSSCTVLLFVCLHVQYCHLSVFMYSIVICLSSCTVLLFVCDFNETWIFLTIFRKILKYQISPKSVQSQHSSSVRTDGQTWRSDSCNKTN